MSDKKAEKIAIIGNELSDDFSVTIAAQKYQIPVSYMSEADILGEESAKILSESRVLYVVKDFSGEVFDKLTRLEKPVLGGVALQQLAMQSECTALTLPKRAVHNYHMKNFIICFAGINKAEMKGLMGLIHFMGGLTREKIAQKITHLISNKSNGERFRLAVNLGISIMCPKWIENTWEQRFQLSLNANDSDFVSQFKIKPFYGLYLTFINFSAEDEAEMKELTIKNGGEVVSVDDERCSHFIIDAILGDCQIQFDFTKIRSHQYVVFKEWFWASIQVANRADEYETAYVYPVPISKNAIRKSASFRSSNDRSSLGIMSPGFEYSSSMDCSELMKSQLDSVKKTIDLSSLSPRNRICLELMQTEVNYVNILNTIIKVFKEPLESPEFGDALLDAIELKTIFGNLPPIIDVHKQVLCKIENIIENWKEDNEIGIIYLDHSQAFLNAYPSYVNYYEKTKEMITECDLKYPRFHAFLRRCQSKPECERQTLQELLIRPVQRLPSVVLLLKDILKKTSVEVKDHNLLSEAIKKIEEVLTKINEDKRKTEGRFAMFDIVNDIKGCPPTLLSSGRQLISKCDVKLLMLVKGEINEFENNLCLLLFNDLLVLCKNRILRRTSSLTSKGSSNYNNTIKKNSKKSFKHVENILLEDVIKVFSEFPNSEDFRNVFVIITRAKGDDKTFRNFPFLMVDKEVNKENFVKTLCKQIALNTSNEIKENFLNEVTNLDFSYANTLAQTLSKSKFVIMLNRTVSISKPRRQSLSHAISTNSLNATPTHLPPSSPSPSRRLSRAFSQFLSPMSLPNRSSPRYLGSMTSLSENFELQGEGNFSLPTTPAPRKKKYTAPNTSNNINEQTK